MSATEILMFSWCVDKNSVLSQQNKGSYLELNKFIKIMNLTSREVLAELLCVFSRQMMQRNNLIMGMKHFFFF